MYQQLTPPDLSVTGQIGDCLHYAGLVFGLTAGPATAWLAWEATQFKHADQNFPVGVSFPAWFSGAGGAGHVVVVTPTGIYSSPWKSGTTHAVLSSIAQVESIYGVKFVGWSEDIEGKQVIKEDTVDPAVLKDFENWKDWGIKMKALLVKYGADKDIGNIDDISLLDAWLADLANHKAASIANGQTVKPTELAPGIYKVS